MGLSRVLNSLNEVARIIWGIIQGLGLNSLKGAYTEDCIGER